MRETEDLEALRQLLLGRELRALDNVVARLGNRVSRTHDVAEVLADAIVQAAQRDPRLAEALQRPVGDCLKVAVRRDPRPIADSLFPVVGPLIRRSIAETMRASVQSLNSVLRHAVSLRGLRMWLEARRTGTPFADVVYRSTLAYRVERLFLIHRGSGLLLAHAADEWAAATDSDAVSGMLSALQDFVRDSFSPDHDDPLSEVEAGERTIWVMHAPHTLLAAVLVGAAPLELRERLHHLHDVIHERYADVLAETHPEPADMPALVDLVGGALEQGENTRESSLRERPWRAWLAVGLVLVLAGVWAVRGINTRAEMSKVHELLAAQPGVVVLATERDRRGIRVSGLRDPLSVIEPGFFADAGIDPARVRLDMIAFQSMEPALMTERVRASLLTPDTVDLRVENGQLRVSGIATVNWIDRTAQAAPYLPGIRSVSMDVAPTDDSIRESVVNRLRPPGGIDLSVSNAHLQMGGEAPGEWLIGLHERVAELPWLVSFDIEGLTPTDASLRTYADGELRPPEGVDLLVRNRYLYISGVAPWVWMKTLPARLNELAWFDGFRVDGLDALEYREARVIADRIEGHRVYFVDGAELTPTSAAMAGALASDISRLDWLAQQLGASVDIKVVGHTDALGSAEQNRQLRAERARVVMDVLRREGMQASALGMNVADGIEDVPDPRRDLDKRRVDFVIALAPPDMPGL